MNFDIDKKIEEATKVSVIYMNLYAIRLCYGGPEEGGWYYDAGECVDSYMIDLSDPETRKNAEKIYQEWKEEFPVDEPSKRHSVLNPTDYVCKFEREEGQDFPQERPYYA